MFVLACLASCAKDIEIDDVFEEAASVRVGKTANELRKILTSAPNGWTTTYFTDNTQLGGYSFMMDFQDDKNVKMVSDIQTRVTESTGEYDIIVGATLKLSFVTKNEIHKLSDAAIYPKENLKSLGYLGDFEFLYYGKDGEDLIFRSNKKFIELRFKKATTEDWEKFHLRKTMQNKLKLSPRISVFKIFTIGDNHYQFNYSNITRSMEVWNNEINEGNKITFGIGFSAKGLTLSPAVEVNGKRVSELLYDQATKGFYGIVDGEVLCSITYPNDPITPFDGYKKLDNISSFVYFLREDWTTNTSSPAFKDSMIALRAYFKRRDVIFETFFLAELDKDVHYLVFSIKIDGKRTQLWYQFTREVKDNKLYFKKNGWTNINESFEAALKPLADLFFTPEGMHVQDSGKLGRFRNQTIRLIPADNPKYAILLYEK